MRQPHPLRTILLLAAVSIAGLIGSLVLPEAGHGAPLILTLAPLIFAAARRRPGSRRRGGGRRSP